MIHHKLENVFHPYTEIVTVGLDWTPHEHLSVFHDTIDRSHGPDTPDPTATEPVTAGGKMPPRHIKRGMAFDYRIDVDPSVSRGNLITELADRYQLGSGPEATGACQTNAKACRHMGADQLSATWLLLAQMTSDSRLGMGNKVSPPNSEAPKSMPGISDARMAPSGKAAISGAVDTKGGSLNTSIEMGQPITELDMLPLAGEGGMTESASMGELGGDLELGLELGAGGAGFFDKAMRQSLVDELIEFYGDAGDPQTCVAISCVVREHVDIEPKLFQMQCCEYIELLHRFRAWDSAAMTARLTKDSLLEKMYDKGSTIYSGCGKCGKPNQPLHLTCDRCKQQATPCVICHLPVQGYYAWCQECGHGGHQHCLAAWYETESLCPAGCGHQFRA